MGSQTTIAVRLKIAETTLSEVVVTALGQAQNKNKVGYSTATFNTAAINKDAPVGLMDGLQGKIAGAEISNTGGPGSSTKVVLRGFGVIAGGSNQPLYVIDGVPLSDAQFQNNTNQAAAGNILTQSAGLRQRDDGHQPERYREHYRIERNWRPLRSMADWPRTERS